MLKNGTIAAQRWGWPPSHWRWPLPPAAAQSTLEIAQRPRPRSCAARTRMLASGFLLEGRPRLGWVSTSTCARPSPPRFWVMPARSTYVPLTVQQRFAELQAGKVDVLARNSTITLQRDVGTGVDFYVREFL